MERTQPYTGEVAQLLALVQARRRYYRDMLSLIPAAAVLFSSDGSVNFANSAFCREFDLREEDVTRQTISQILPISCGDLQQRILAGRGVSPAPFFFELRGRTLRISVIPIRKALYIRENDILLLIESSREIQQVSPGLIKNDTILMRSEPVLNSQIPAILWHAERHSLAFIS